jgi:hypothetical protein
MAGAEGALRAGEAAPMASEEAATRAGTEPEFAVESRDIAYTSKTGEMCLQKDARKEGWRKRGARGGWVVTRGITPGRLAAAQLELGG